MTLRINARALDPAGGEPGNAPVITPDGKVVKWTEITPAAHQSEPAGAHAASSISVEPVGDITATNVQSALVELDTIKVKEDFPDYSLLFENGLV